MKDLESAPVTSPPAEKRILFLGAMLASFIVCFVVFGCITYVDISDLRGELKEIKEIDMLTFPESADSSLAELDESDDEDDEDDDIEGGIPDWVPSFPVLGFMPSIPPTNISEMLPTDEAHVRVRRSARECQGCCRDCDCSTKRRKKTAKNRRNCKGCCKNCGSHKYCKSKPNGETVKTINTLFKSRLGHFIGSNKLQTGANCGSRFKSADRPYALTTDTGDICAWKYATWMKEDAKKLYNLQNSGKVKVRDAGMYYIYGQLIVYDSKPTASLGIMIKDPADDGKVKGRERELAKCIETAGYLIGEHGVIADPSGSFRTCNMNSVTELREGSEVYIVVHLPKTSNGKKIPVKTFHQVTTAFFGIIKYT